MASRGYVRLRGNCTSIVPRQSSTLRLFQAERLLTCLPRREFTTSTPPAEVVHRTETLVSPLAALPRGSLIRSLCINGITSKSWLLAPSLFLTTLLSKPGRWRLFSLEGNRLLAWLTKASLYKQFCAGETPAEVKSTMKAMKDMGFRGTILTFAQETVFDSKAGKEVAMCSELPKDEGTCQVAISWCNGTMKTVEMLEEGDQLAIKLTGAGPGVTEALAAGELPPKQIMDTLEEISRICKERGSHLVIDAESQLYQPGISRLGLNLMQKYNRDGQTVIYNSYQAYLKAMPSKLAAHLAEASKEGFTLGLKLVRGAYMSSDPRNLIHDTKEETDQAFNQIAQGVIRQDVCGFDGTHGKFPKVNLIIASHNKESVYAAHALHQQRSQESLPTVPVRFAQLQGMADDLSLGLLHINRNGGDRPEVYKCSTWGGLGECMGYLARRALENRDAAGRTLDAYEALKKEAKRRVVAIFSAPRM